MPKLYYPSPDELQGAPPLNELIWFEQYQSQLVVLANTNEGRDLLCIDSWKKMPYPVVEISKCYVKFYMGQEGGRDYYTSDFRVGSKWGNVIRYRWQQVRVALSRIELQEMMAWQSLGGRQRVMARFATTVFYPDAHVESSTVDGHVQWLGPTTSDWSSIRRASNGTDINSASTYAQMLSPGSGVGPNWQHLSRSLACYNTGYNSPLASPQTIVSATWQACIVWNLPNYSQQIVVVELDALASPTAIATSDYTKFVNSTSTSNLVELSDRLAEVGIGTGLTNYNTWTLNSAGISEINISGITYLGITMYPSDVNNDVSAVTQVVNHSSNTNWASADTSGTTSDPKLVVIHSGPFTPRALMF